MYDETGLTRNQLLIWLGQEATPDLPVFNEMVILVIGGSIERTLFDRALQAVIDASDALRTVVRRVDGLPRSEVLEQLRYTSTFLDMSGEDEPRRALDEWARRHADLLLDISHRAFESTLIKLSESEYAWSLLQHHIICDLQSVAIVTEHLGDTYERMVAGDHETLPDPTSFADYVEYERELAQTDRFAKYQAFWEQRTSQPPDPVTFYDGRTLSTGDGLRRMRTTLELGREQSDVLRQFSGRDGIRFLSDDLTSFSVIACALLVYLHRLSGQDKIAIGVPWQNRRKEFAGTIGLLMEQNPLIVELQASDTFESVIKKVQRESVQVMRHMPYAAGNPGGRIYQVGLNYAKASANTFAGLPFDSQWHRSSFGIGGMDLHVHDFSKSGEISLTFDFNESLFAPAHRDAAVNHFVNCLLACLDDPTRPIGSVDMMTVDEHRVLSEWNATETSYPRHQTVVELFEAQVATRPTAIAVRCGDAELSYRDLDHRASALAGRLRSLGVRPGVSVGVCVERSLDLLTAMIGVMKTGGAYVPMDPYFPPERLAFMLSDSEARVLVTETASLESTEPSAQHVICLDELDLGCASELTARPGEATAERGTADDVAYVLYTSGSTGKPKGVEITSQALMNFLCAMREEPGCDHDDVLLAVTTPAFDISGLELYLPLIVGGRVEIAPRAVAADGRLLRRRLEVGDITVLQATPATWRMLIDADWSGTDGLKALIGGESLPPDLVPLLLDRTDSLWNMYGPTETTIWSSIQQILHPGAEITVGRPIANTTFYILDEQLRPVPIGVSGELCIGGDGVGLGYRGREQLTAEKFVLDPFSSTPGARMYRTGDLARFRVDGQVVLLGRIDHQVKIRGYRIEPGEIDARLASHPAVRQSVAIAREDRPGVTRLVAYCVAGEDGPAPAADIRRHLRGSLPHYMVPQQFVWVDALPLTANGKIDREQLPSDTGTAAPTAHSAPRTPTEERVASLFAELLDLGRVDDDADFYELGGESLLAVKLMARVEHHFEVHLPLHVVFQSLTVADLSDRICDVTGAERAPADPRTGLRVSDRHRWTTTERALADVWTSVVGTPVVSLNDSFIEMQGSRDLLPRMLAKTREAFGVVAEGISAVEFEADPTLASLARTVDSGRRSSPGLLVPLQQLGTRPPVFFIHAAGGYVYFYRALAARLAPDQPVYGVRAATRDDGPGRPFERSKSVEELARRYVEEIRTVQPHGPYALGGASFGGVLAFEMARQLVASGDALAAPILLFDSYVADPWQPPPSDESPRLYDLALLKLANHLRPEGLDGREPTVRNVVEEIVRTPKAVRTLAPLVVRGALWRLRLSRTAQGLRHGAERLRSRSVPRDVAQQRTTERSLQATYRLLRGYRPTPYAGRAVLFEAEHGYDPKPGWIPVIAGGFDTHVMPGAHLDMLEEPVVVETAALVERYLGSGPSPSS